jgi:hypothetical protein
MLARGEVPERLNGPVLKTGEAQVSVGSNPTLSATFCHHPPPAGTVGAYADGAGGIVVKLINADGLVFVGTGSEWFWTAISGIVLVITFLAIYRQLRLQANAKAIDELDAWDRVGNSERWNRYALDIYIAIRGRIDPATVPDYPGVLATDLPADLPDTAYDYCASTIERLATLYRTGRLDLKLLARHNTFGPQSWWTMLEPAIRAERISSGRPSKCENFEWFAGYMSAIDRRAGLPAVTSGTIARNLDGWIALAQEKIRVEEVLRSAILVSTDPATVAQPRATAAQFAPATADAPQAAPG